MTTNKPIEFLFRGTRFEVEEVTWRSPGRGRRGKTYYVTDPDKKATWCIEGLKVSKVKYRDDSYSREGLRSTNICLDPIVTRDLQEFFVDLIDEFCDLHDV